jgi:hypothetical protein
MQLLGKKHAHEVQETLLITQASEFNSQVNTLSGMSIFK